MIYSIIISAAWLLILAAGLAWCIGNLIGARREERRTRPEQTVDYRELEHIADVRNMIRICKEVASWEL